MLTQRVYSGGCLSGERDRLAGEDDAHRPLGILDPRGEGVAPPEAGGRIEAREQIDRSERPHRLRTNRLVKRALQGGGDRAVSRRGVEKMAGRGDRGGQVGVERRRVRIDVSTPRAPRDVSRAGRASRGRENGERSCRDTRRTRDLAGGRQHPSLRCLRPSVRELVMTENITLDGVIDAAEGWFAPSGDNDETDASDVLAVLQQQMKRQDGLLLGRVTFEQFRGYWPQQKDDSTGSPRISTR